MTWNPARARAVLDGSAIATFIRAVDKASAYKVGAQTIALADQNLEQVSIYSTAAPKVDDVVLTRECPPATVKKRGRARASARGLARSEVAGRCAARRSAVSGPAVCGGPDNSRIGAIFDCC